MTQSKEKGLDGPLYIAKYLIQDDGPFCLDDYRMGGDDALFHVNYHRDYWITSKVVSEDDIRRWYEGEKIDQQKDYWIFPLKSLIHSGVWLELGTGGFQFDPGGWDTSHVGAVLVSKKEWRLRKSAEKAALSLVTEINQINSGDVYCCVKETFDKDKKSIDYDIVGGYIGLDYAKSCLDKEF